LPTEIILLVNICTDYQKGTGSTNGRMEIHLVDSSNKERSTATGFGKNLALIQIQTIIRANILTIWSMDKESFIGHQEVTMSAGMCMTINMVTEW